MWPFRLGKAALIESRYPDFWQQAEHLGLGKIEMFLFAIAGGTLSARQARHPIYAREAGFVQNRLCLQVPLLKRGVWTCLRLLTVLASDIRSDS